MAAFSARPNNDGTLKDQDEANPFSFKEFVKSKNRSAMKDEQKDRMYQKGPSRPVLVSEESSSVLNRVDMNLEFQEPIFKDSAVDDMIEDEEDSDWSASYRPSIIEESHGARTTSPSLNTTSDSFSFNPSELSGIKTFVKWPLNDSNDFDLHSLDLSCMKASQDFIAHGSPVEYMEFHSLQINYEIMKEENSNLRRAIHEMQKLNETQTEKVRKLERKLKEKVMEEEKEAQDLESMVQQVEQNLQMMTKRAVKAENSAAKLKQEIALLQTELRNCRAENEALHMAEKANVAAVKQNTHFALENLHKVVNNAQSFITWSLEQKP
ncbi:endosome-associated-trafficking regulator 1 isoform X3 [Rhinatrema bivittatum]|uniref:endosome-associated-trafficking regulator 1 isoform X3 n=1 Tax=Rhinatrema bivittatum TaxID=194408 RepID=UPI00112AC6AF|nr:endosome-associated-trafficking regulator 1 isoform X3 [Rhinatrema bivittatum]